MTKKQLQEKVEKLGKLEKKFKKLEAEIKELKEELKSEMIKKQIKEIETDNFKFSIIEEQRMEIPAKMAANLLEFEDFVQVVKVSTTQIKKKLALDTLQKIAIFKTIIKTMIREKRKK